MENSLLPNFVLNSNFLSFFSNFTYLVYGVLSLILAVFVFSLLIVYKKVRRKFPLNVNCWFCNKNTAIPYELSNSWDCPHCKQYNGFNKDGDYNKIIPEQYNSKLNKSIFKTLRTSVESSPTSLQTNGFCKLCNINQQLKIQQLALFVPLNENKYYEEIEEYREKLEKAYKLCSKCEKTLHETLEKQEYSLLQSKLNSHKISFPSQKIKTTTKFGGNNLLVLLKKNGILGLKFIQSIFAALLFFALLIHFETEYQYLRLPLPDSAIVTLEPILPILKVLLHCKDEIYRYRKELSFVGLLFCFFVNSEKHVKKNHIILLAWGLLHISLWSSLTQLHVLMSGLCVFLSIKMTNNKLIYLNKKSLPKKSSFQPLKRVFPESYSISRGETSQNSGLSSPLLKSKNITSLNEDPDVLENKPNRKAKQKLKKVKSDENKNMRRKENEIESALNEEKDKMESTTFNSSPNSSCTNKSYILSSVEMDKTCGDSNEPLNDVFSTLNSLQLGGKPKKSNKLPNFLFANHNFSEGKNSSSIIKPAKFIKNLNSTSWTESNECNSRSSTPSSGYFSQKPEKMESNRYDFPKTVSPVSLNSFNRHSPNHYFDYYNGNHGFYNNMNCFSPGFVPFQQFPGSLGHTTIYTCTRPTNFSFPFSPWQGYSPQKVSPSSRFSDVDCDNLFQESSKKFAKNQKWLNLQAVFYYFSIFLNFITIMSLIYFTSAGIISVDWNLPKFNFFM